MVDDSEDIKSGFKITFRFKSNPFFEDSELQKSVNFTEDGILHVDGTPPNWKEGMVSKMCCELAWGTFW